MKRFTWFVMLTVATILIIAGNELPPMGDPNAPASTHVSSRYIEQGHAETGAPNLVTAVLADYRSYDTLGETAVIFTAGLACALILSLKFGGKEASEGDDA